jgi:hypothetical protein
LEKLSIRNKMFNLYVKTKGVKIMAKHYHCPVNGYDCPYYEEQPNHNCVCTLENPMDECDDFAGSWEGSEPDEYTDEHDDPYTIADPMTFY